MKKRITLLAFLISTSMAFIRCTTDQTIVNEYIVNGSDVSNEKVITNYGAVGDGKTDCSDIINTLIKEMPISGGVIVIPEGDFVLDKPITIDRNYITIRGTNAGIRSNVDVKVEDLLGPGGGSKLILRNTAYGIHIPILSNVNGSKNRISGVEVKDILISGGVSNKGTGIYIQQDNDRCRISNVIGINLNIGINVLNADAIIIRDCWISEVANSIVMTGGIQNMITNCQLGAQPSGVTCKLENEENFVFTGNHVYPDGSSNFQLINCRYVNVTANNFQSYYVGMIELGGNNNLVSSNIFWMRNSSNQLRGKPSNYGVIRVEGDMNQISNNTVKCDWNPSLENPVTIRSVSGKNNVFTNLVISDQTSSTVFYVNETSRILDCVPASKVHIDGDLSSVYIRY